MREVFRSPRLENVEGAAELLKSANIETTVWNGRSYKGGRRRTFSYRDPIESGAVPQLWVVHNGDLPEARRLLREAGLIEPSQRDSFLNDELRFATRDTEKTPWLTPQNMRTLVLIAIVAVVGAMTWYRVSVGI